MAAIPFRGVDRTGRLRNTAHVHTYRGTRRTIYRRVASGIAITRRSCAGLVPSTLLDRPKRENQKRGGTERKETTRKRGTWNHDKKIQHEHGSCGRDGRGCTSRAERRRAPLFCPEARRGGRVGRDLVLPYERSWKYAPMSDREGQRGQNVGGTERRER